MKITKPSRANTSLYKVFLGNHSNVSDYYNFDSINGQAHYKKKKVYTNLTYKHKCKTHNRNPQCVKPYCNITKNFSPRLKGQFRWIHIMTTDLRSRRCIEWNSTLIHDLKFLGSWKRKWIESNKEINQKAKVNIILSGEIKNQVFVLKSGIKQGYFYSTQILLSKKIFKQTTGTDTKVQRV